MGSCVCWNSGLAPRAGLLRRYAPQHDTEHDYILDTRLASCYDAFRWVGLLFDFLGLGGSEAISFSFSTASFGNRRFRASSVVSSWAFFLRSGMGDLV